MSVAVKSAEKTRSNVKIRRVNGKDIPGNIAYWVGVILTLGFILIPIFWIALTSLKTYQQAFTLDVFFQPTLDNFKTIFDDPLNMGPKLLNSVIVGTITVAIAIPWL